MGDRRPKTRSRPSPTDGPPDPFAAYGLRAADFDVECGRGKSLLSGQRLVWVTVRHRATGRAVSGKTGTAKRDADHQVEELLRDLLRSFRPA